MEDLDQIYEIEIDYKVEEHDLVRTLSALNQFIDGEERLSNIFLKFLGQEDVQKTVLVDIHAGSIKTVLKSTLFNVDDEQIREKGYKAFVAQFLIEIKNYFIDFLRENSQIDHEKIKEFRNGIVVLAENNGIKDPNIFKNLSVSQILDGFDYVSNPTKMLDRHQDIRKKYRGKIYTVNKNSDYDRAKITEELSKKEIIYDKELILLVRRPDYLKNSKWDFYSRMNGSFSAKILDERWLRKFQNNTLNQSEIPLPKDELRVKANIILVKDSSGGILFTEYEIIQVIEVIKHTNDYDNQFDF